MPTHNRFRRFLAGFGLVLLVLAIGFPVANRFIPGWGSTPAEQAQALSGDDLFQHPVLKWEHAITIQAAPEEVWPWIIQMGDTRAGYYSYRFVEKAITALAGIDASSYYRHTNTIHPEWQTPEIGQGMLMDVLTLRDYRVNEYLVAGPKPDQEEAGLSWTWALVPQPGRQTRLLVHMRIQIPGMEGNQLVGAALNLATFMMERKMMDGIKLHAEGGVEADWVQVAEALLWFAGLCIGFIAAYRFITQKEWKLALGIGLAVVVLLFGLVYLQPALWLRLVLIISLAGALVMEARLQGEIILLPGKVEPAVR